MPEKATIKIGRRTAFCILLSSIALGAVPRDARGAARQIAGGNFLIEYEDIADETATVALRELEAALQTLKAYLKLDYNRQVTVEVGNRFQVPAATPEDAHIRIPANRLSPGGAIVNLPPVVPRGMTFYSAVQNVIAPTAQGPRDWGRFITEGLGVYLQSKFGGRTPTPWPAATYPTLGTPLTEATVALANEIGILPLPEAVRLLNDRRESFARRLAWLQAGSLVGYVVETWGIERFMAWYGTDAPFEKAYPVPLEAAERDWRTKVLKIAP